MNGKNLTIALPNKGRLYEETLKFLDKCALRVRRENERQYDAKMDGLADSIDVVFQRARDIPKVVGEGRIDLGINGFDFLWEKIVSPFFQMHASRRKGAYLRCPMGTVLLSLLCPITGSMSRLSVILRN